MAEEGNLGVARALDTDEDATKADLQHRMDEARESITETVTEIKETVVNQYNSVKESVTDALDWREQVRKRPVACSIGALGVGILVGYSLAGVIEGENEPGDYPASDQQGSYDNAQATPVQNQAGDPSAFTDHHSYAAHARATAGTAYGSSDEGLDSRPSYSSGYEQTASGEDKPGLIDRFKETRAYDRLQEEVSDLGNRFMDELSNAARTIVLPALFNKVKEMIGIDLSNKRHTGGTATQQPVVDPTPRAQTSSTDRHQTQAASEEEVGGPSEGGKAAYPRTKGSPGKFDRLVSDTPSPGGQSDHSPHINLNYDDRYERESKLFTRGENRGFAAGTHGESKTPTSDVRNTDRDDAPRGKDYKYEPGRTDNS